MLPQDRKQHLLSTSNNRIVPPLIHARFHEPFFLADIYNCLHFISSVIANPEPCELPFPPFRVHGPARLLEWRGPIRGMEVHNIDFLDAQRLQRRSDTVGYILSAVGAGGP